MRAVMGAVVSAMALVGWSTPAAEAAPVQSYIVVLSARADADGVAKLQGKHLGFTAEHVYRHALHGYSARMTSSAADALMHDARVVLVVPDLPVSMDATSTQVVPAGITRVGADRSSTRAGDGRGAVSVNVAVLDTGIDPTHPDLNVAGGVACRGKTFVDGNGHGTHVSGTIAARDDGQGVVGVAPGARIWGVKVLDDQGGGNASSVLCGLDWVTGTRTDSDPSNDIAVVNMSLGGKGYDDGQCGALNKDAMHAAICRAVAAGVTFVVAAGNSPTDIAGHVPAGYKEVLTATAMADFDGLPGGLHDPLSGECGYGNYRDDSATGWSGFATSTADQAHTVAAPGACVLSDWPGGGTARESGTSMATPHTAGVVAMCIAHRDCAGLTPAQIVTKIHDDALAYLQSQPSSGFAGDPLRPTDGRYYGPLVRSASY